MRLAQYARFYISSISEHLTTCEHARHITDLHNLYDNVKPDKPFTNYKLITNGESTKMLQTLEHTNSNLLLFLEALHNQV